MTSPPHDLTGHARCPLCGSSAVEEIFPENDPRHRHVCLNKDCDKITSNRRRKAAGLPVRYPGVK
jgi:transposase-like protein